eukprot:gene9936-10956_t
MSNVQIRTASCILKEQFGENVEKVVVYLLRKGRKSLRDVTLNTHLDKDLAKKCMCIAIQHQLARFEKNKNGPITYRAEIENILLRTRYPKFVYNAKVMFGDIAELIVESVLMNGADMLSRIVDIVSERLNSQDEQQSKISDSSIVCQKLVELIERHYLRRLVVPGEEDLLDEKGDNISELGDEEAFTIPVGVLNAIGSKRKRKSKTGEPASKRSKSDSAMNDLEDPDKDGEPDQGIFWHVNFEMFQQHLFDQVIQSAISEKIDQSAGRIVNVILKQTEMERSLLDHTTRSLASFEIMKHLPDLPVITQQELAQYLSLISDQKIEEMAMIPFKETKELLYKMFQERFVNLQEVSKSGDYAPSRTFYLFSVDLPQVARLLLNRAYQAMANLMIKRDSLTTEHKRLLEKNERIQGFLSALGQSEDGQEDAIQELEELITPVEKEQLNRLKIDLAR